MPASAASHSLPPAVVRIDKPSTQVRYAVEDREPPLLREEVASFAERCCKGRGRRAAEGTVQ